MQRVAWRYGVHTYDLLWGEVPGLGVDAVWFCGWIVPNRNGRTVGCVLNVTDGFVYEKDALKIRFGASGPDIDAICAFLRTKGVLISG